MTSTMRQLLVVSTSRRTSSKALLDHRQRILTSRHSPSLLQSRTVSSLRHRTASLPLASSSAEQRSTLITRLPPQNNFKNQECCHRCFSTMPIDLDHEMDDSSSENMSSKGTPFLLADIGEGIAEVEVLQFFVQSGDTVRQFDRICEVQSDKATVEITSRFDGTVTQLGGAAGDMISVGQPLLYILEDTATTTTTTTRSTSSDEKEPIDENHHHHHHPADAATTPTVVVPQEPIPNPLLLRDDDDNFSSSHELTPNKLDLDNNDKKKQTPVLTTPAIRKLAREYDIDLGTIVGSGPKGRVLKGDVLAFLKETGRPHKNKQDIDSTYTAQSLSPTPPPPRAATENTIVQLKGYNRLMAKSMAESLKIPHMVYADEVEMGKLLSIKGTIAVLPFIIKATSAALGEFPILNARFDSVDQITLLGSHNIGIAMDTDRGLVVPVIHECQDKSIDEITQELLHLKDLAKSSSFGQEHLTGGTFTISNIGAVGSGTYMSPLITAPQVGIGALGKINRVPRFTDDSSMDVEEAFVMNVSWAADHRLVDGASLARFHNLWKKYLESPVDMLSKMR